MAQVTTSCLAREDAFVEQYPRLHCPSCHRRLSVRYGNVDAGRATEVVRMHCYHCNHRFTVPRVRPDGEIPYGEWS